MKKITYTIAMMAAFFSLTSCTITEEIHLDKKGAGDYDLHVDFSDLFTQMKGMGGDANSEISNMEKSVDTIIYFKDILEEKKDSIATLSAEKQMRFKSLEDIKLQVSFGASESAKQQLSLSYPFKDVTKVYDKLSTIDELTSKTVGEEMAKLPEMKDKFNFSSLAPAYTFKMSKRSFNRAVDISKLEKKSENKEENAQINMFAQMFKFKQIVHLPYKIKDIDNDKARVLPGFKGYEISGSIMELDTNPNYYDVKVDF